jgi:hypothetical protein
MYFCFVLPIITSQEKTDKATLFQMEAKPSNKSCDKNSSDTKSPVQRVQGPLLAK